MNIPSLSYQKSYPLHYLLPQKMPLVHTWVSLLVAALLLAPSGGATDDPASASSAGADDCWNPGAVQIPRCHLFTNATVNVTACGADACDLDIRAGAYGIAGPLPGLLNVGSTMMIHQDGGGGSICLGPKALTDPTQDVFPCNRLCHATAVGVSASCEGKRMQAVRLAPGECVTIVIAGEFMYDPYNGFAAFAMFFKVCREGGGAPYAYALPM